VTGRIPYYSVVNGRAFFRLGKNKADRAGMLSSYPLGKASRSTERAAIELYWQWQDKSGRATPKKQEGKYPRGTLGHWYLKYRNLDDFKSLSKSSLADWDYAWRHIEKRLSMIRIDRITPMVFADFYHEIDREYTENNRWKIIKYSRALFNAAVRYGVIDKSPCLVVKNPQPAGRSQIWFSHEIKTLIETANHMGHESISLAIELLWETLLSPIDVRKLPLSALKKDNQGFYIETIRSKTQKPVYAHISQGLGERLEAYISGLGFSLHPDQPILRTKRDGSAYLKARLGSEFSKVRSKAFGPDEKRQMRDIRRSGNVEADLGGASPEDRAEILANTLHKSSVLEGVYTPPTVAKARKLAKNRAIGRDILDQQSRNAPAKKPMKSEKT